MRRNKNGKTVPQDLFVFLVLGLLAAVLAAVVHLLYHTEYAETPTIALPRSRPPQQGRLPCPKSSA